MTIHSARVLRKSIGGIATLASLLGTTPWLQADDSSLQGADQSVQTSLTQFNQARHAYLTTAKEKGKDNPQTKIAQANYQAARQNWQQKVQSRRQLRQQARKQMDRNRHQGVPPAGNVRRGARGF